ncbi:MAG: sulfotransferase family 2 domain-containing protein [Pseudomonadota bacterium]
MVISHELKFVFIEVPHTGSHSITQELLEHFSCERILRKHANLSQFLGQASKEERKYFKFATVRNPLDTAVTDYCKLEGNHKGQYTNPSALLKNGGHVTEEHLAQFNFIHDNQADFSDFMREFRNKIYHNWFLLGSEQMDFVIRFEDLQSGYKEALKRIGVQTPRDLPHVNPTKKKRKNFTEFYSEDIRDMIVANYGPFMQKWNYSFPETWGERSIPLTNRMRFDALEKSVNTVSRYFTLDPDTKVVGSLKRMVEKVA